jgi:glycosyltransferase involved in cell wall biosynthesis
MVEMETHANRLADDDRPLLTFLQLSYNQERFIREAVEGAFAQTYSPLEILLSDDGSSDRSFEIMSEMAASYRGPHKLVLNRNPGNLGKGPHISRAMEIAKGELILIADGDDISLDVRAERSYREWVRTGRTACSLFANGIMFDAREREIGKLIGGEIPSHARTVEEAVSRGGIGVAGCTHMFMRRCFDVFGPMTDRTNKEDMTIPFRSLLLGEVRYLDEPLIRYRVHGGNDSGEFGTRPTLSFRIREAEDREIVYFSWLKDTQTAFEKGLLTAERAERIRNGLLLLQYWANVEKRYLRSNPWNGLRLLFSSMSRAANMTQALKIMERRFRSRA